MNPGQQQEDIVSDIFDGYQDTQKEIFGIESRKTRIKLFTIAFVIFLFDFIALSRAGFATINSILIISIIPLVITGLGILAVKEPLIAMIITLVIIAGLWIIVIIKFGSMGIIAGWLSKVIIIYLLIAGFQNAREAQRIKKELKL